MPSGSHSPDDDQPTIPPSAGGIPDQDATQAPTSSATDIGPRDLPQLEDYELLEELGRGGMGVVYKARQKKLDRTVALKMILGGQFASEEAVRRFELEAETAARLDHPGIVPIYEIGQSGGNHFFSMKLIEGKSLDQEQDQYKNDPRKSVELMIEIAHAVQHAHERGVLHRDLKPANILIDNDGNAAVTDLGLAKVLDDDSGLTQTGLVMGSPGFMSPEQAAGKSDVTTAVDVYSLGAVLYWLIAGRPPFQAETRLEVILQTIDSTPESVRVYRPDADRDLNLICQKALQKSPKDRYVSASEFATDLQAWLDGDPLSVKPPTTIDLARNWIRKNFRTVAMALASGILCGLTVGLIILLVQVSNLIDFTADQYAMLGETETPWVLRYFYWVKSIPNWILVIMPPAMVWMNVVFGIATIRLIKPKSREVGLVAATAAALLSGIVAFMVSFGWAPITTQAISAGQDDIELLSAAMWMAEGSERKLAQRALVQRYPGLKDLNTRKKVYLVRRKIMSDQSFAVPKAMWIGILTTMCLTVFPLFFTTMFSGLLWDKGDRGWAYFGKSIELGTYSTLFFLVTTKFVTNSVGISPGFVFQVVALAGLGLALYWAVSDKKVAWRIAGFLLANFCIMSNFAESGNIDKAWQFAQNAITEKELRTAARYYDKRLVRNDTPWVRYQVGILAAYRNDDAKHAEMCHQLLSNFKNVHRPDVAEQIVKLSLLKPGSLTDSELATVHELAEIVSGYGPSFDQKWLFFAKAMSEMRQGNLAETLDWNSRCRDVVNSNTAVSQPYLVASTYVVDALAYQQTGDLSKVDQSLDNARQTIETVTDSTKFSWLQRMVFEVLLEEVSGSRTFKRTASD